MEVLDLPFSAMDWSDTSGSGLFEDWIDNELYEDYVLVVLEDVFNERGEPDENPQGWNDLWEDPEFVRNNQTGGSANDELLYTINNRVRRDRFGAVESDYTFTLPSGLNNVVGVDNILEVVDRMMSNILSTVVRGNPDDRVRFVMQMDGLKNDTPISLSFILQRELTVDCIYDEVNRVIQSGTIVELNTNFKVNVIWVYSTQVLGGRKVKKKRGAGRVFNMEDFARASHSVVRVTDRDKMCLARCLVVSLKREKKEESSEGAREYERIRKVESVYQTKEGRKLCRECGVDADTYCTLEDVARFESCLNAGLESPKYRLVVFSQSHLFTPVYAGERVPVPIYLYLKQNH